MSAGKGDAPRKVNGDIYRKHFDEIFRKPEWPDIIGGSCFFADPEDPVWDGPPRKEPPMKVNEEGDE